MPVTGTITTWAGGTLGSMSNYGTSPGPVLVPGVNAFITGGGTVSSAPGTAPPSGNTVQTQGCAGASTGCIPAVTQGIAATVQLNPGVTNGAYTAGFSLGGLMTFAVLQPGLPPSGLLTGFNVTGKVTADNAAQLIVYLFTKTPGTPCSDHVAYTPAAADLQYQVPGSPFSITTAYPGALASGNNSAFQPLAQWVANQDTVLTQNIMPAFRSKPRIRRVRPRTSSLA